MPFRPASRIDRIVEVGAQWNGRIGMGGGAGRERERSGPHGRGDRGGELEDDADSLRSTGADGHRSGPWVLEGKARVSTGGEGNCGHVANLITRVAEGDLFGDLCPDPNASEI